MQRAAAILMLLLLVSANPSILQEDRADDPPEEMPEGYAGPDDGARSVPVPHVIINEYLPAPKDRYTSEWVELYNAGDEARDISDWYLSDSLSRKYTFPAGTLLEPGGYILVQKTLGLNNGGDDIRLFNSADQLMDIHSYDDSDYDTSWGRSPDGSVIWTVFSDPTPGKPNPGPPRVVINELMADPVGSDTYGEWLELYNNGTRTVDLKGWTLTDQEGSGFTMPPVFMPGGSYLLVREAKGDDETDLSDGAGTIYTGKSTRWSNTGDDILLTDAGGVGIDYIAYGVSKFIDPPPPELEWRGRWWDSDIDNYTAGMPNPEVSEGEALALAPDGADTDRPDCWRHCMLGTETPGGGNDRSYRFSLKLRTGEAAVAPGERYVTEAVLHNLGNTGGTFDLDVIRLDPGEGWQEGLMFDNVYLGPGKRTAVTLSVTAPGVGDGDLSHTFSVNGTRRGAPPYAADESSATMEVRLAGVDICPTPLTVEYKGRSVDTVAEGIVVELGLSLRNNGTEKGGAFDLSFYLDKLRGKARIGRISYASITPGYAKRPHMAFDTLGHPGDHTIIAVADKGNTVAEIDESNNHALVDVTVIPTSPAEGDYAVKITRLYPDTAVPDEPDEFVSIENSGAEAVNLSGWSIGEAGESDRDRYATFPEGILLEGGTTLVLARETVAFAELTRQEADLSCDHPDLSRRLIAPRGWPVMSNSGDEVVLRDCNRHVIDAVHYGTGTPSGDGWKVCNDKLEDEAAETAPAPKEGTLLQRRTASAGSLIDTNTSLDWTVGERPGREIFPSSAGPLNGTLTTSEYGGSYPLLSSIVEMADEEVLVFSTSTGMLPEPSMVLHRIENGTAVTIAALAGDIPYAYLDPLHQAGARILLVHLDRGSGGIPRQAGFTGGYAVADGRWVCTLPSEDDPLPFGGVMYDAPGAAGLMADVFHRDADPHWGDCDVYAPSVDSGGEPPDPEWRVTADTTPPPHSHYSPVEHNRNDTRIRPLIYPDDGDPLNLVRRSLSGAEGSVLLIASPGSLQGKLGDVLWDLPGRDVRVRLLVVPPGDEQWFDGAGTFTDDGVTGNPFALARDFNAHAGAVGRPAEARVLFTQDPLPAGKAGILAIIDGDEVTWLGGDALEAAPGELPRSPGVRIRGAGAVRQFTMIFKHLWEGSPGADAPGEPAGPVISQVYFDTRIAGEPDESFTIANPAGTDMDLSGWLVTDNEAGGGTYEGMLRFPPGLILEAGEELAVAREAGSFHAAFGDRPDLQYGGHMDDVSRAQTFGRGLTLGNSGDELFLVDPAGRVVDTVVYGGSARNATGWSGPPVPPVTEGRLLKRASHESALAPGTPEDGYADTNTSRDWVSPRQYRPGQSAFVPETFTADRLTVFVSPDSSFGAIRDLLNGARESIRLAVYQCMDVHLVSLLCNASRRGVDVAILLEGGPVGGVTVDQKAASDMLYKAGCKVMYLVSDSSSGVYARYDYVHAKYVVVDGESVAVMSENWVATGMPFYRTGNRGMGVVVHDPAAAGYFLRVFCDDTDLSRPDVALYDPSAGADATDDDGDDGAVELSLINRSCGPPSPGHVLEGRRPRYDYRPRFPARVFHGPAKVTPVVSPDTSVHPDTILGMLDSARKSILVQQLELAPDWGWRGREQPNLYLEALLDASRRGVSVRVLLDSAFVGHGEDYDNADMVEELNALAVEEGLDLRADLIHLDGGPGTRAELSKIHNKALVVDSEKVLVSSINWVRGAALLNREAGLIIEHGGVAGYFSEVFWFDWNLSVQREVSVRITPGNEIVLVPGTTWDLNIRVTLGERPEGDEDPARPIPASNLSIGLTDTHDGWVWSFGDDGGTMVTLALLEGEERSVRLRVTAPAGSYGGPGDVTVPVHATMDGRRCQVGSLTLRLEGSGGGITGMFNGSFQLEGVPEESEVGGSDGGEPYLAIATLICIIICLSVGREYAKRWWKRREKRKTGS